MIHDGVERGVDAEFLVGPDGDDTAGTEHATALGIEALEVEPVHGLRRRDERGATVAQRQPLGEPGDVLHADGRQGAAELRHAAVDGDHPLEMVGQRHRGLAAAGRAIDGEAPDGASDATYAISSGG